ncbi:hypothetical protein DSO57_1027889 [Entomophthora muscae]|uniref:Uncharacterized protein n=1 Tax=Entomophthora muscae TaxID=34485 RepID=A0ACC2TCR1_9FUNG|nr:hypothetical protein DSO57_1027889 [Entomophthora muscae]
MTSKKMKQFILFWFTAAVRVPGPPEFTVNRSIDLTQKSYPLGVKYNLTAGFSWSGGADGFGKMHAQINKSNYAGGCFKHAKYKACYNETSRSLWINFTTYPPAATNALGVDKANSLHLQSLFSKKTRTPGKCMNKSPNHRSKDIWPYKGVYGKVFLEVAMNILIYGKDGIPFKYDPWSIRIPMMLPDGTCDLIFAAA